MSMSIFRNLPEELIDEILSLYWQDIYSKNVINELNAFFKLAEESKSISKNINYNLFDKISNDTLKSWNEILLKLVNNKALRIVSIRINPNLKWITGNDYLKLFKNVSKSYKLICAYFVNLSGEFRYNIFHYFCELSTSPDSSVGRAMDCNGNWK